MRVSKIPWAMALLPLLLGLTPGCSEDAPLVPAPQEPERYLANRAVAAGPTELATRPPWRSMQQRDPASAARAFQGRAPARQRIEDLCCADTQVRSIQDRLEQGAAARALAESSRVLHELPDNDLARLVHARAARRQGRIDVALREFQNTVTRAPGLHEAHLAVGQLLSERSRHDEALAALDRALLLASTPEAHLARGIALCRSGRTDEAEQDLWKAVEGNSRDGLAYYALAWLAASRGQPAQVIHLLRFAARDQEVFEERINRKRLMADTGFRPVHDHPGFVQYLAALPADPLAAAPPESR